MEQAVQWFKWEGDNIKNNIEQLVLESDVGNSKYVDSKKWELLRRSCKEMVTGYELLVRSHSSHSEKYAVDKNGLVVLGLTNFYETSQAVVDHLGGTIGNLKYMDYEIDASGRGHTKQFMKKLLADPEVKEIIFLVPPKMFRVESETGNATRKEFVYLLEHPELADKVRLVFGAYEMIERNKFNKDTWASGGVIDKSRPTKMERSARRMLAKEFMEWLESLKVSK